MNIQIQRQKLADMNKEMQQISNLARAYANATDGQRANVNINDMRAQMDRYENLKKERDILQQEVVANEMAYERALQEQQAQAQKVNARGTWRRVPTKGNNDVPTWTPTSDPTGTLTDEQYAEWLAELEKEAYLSNPHPIFNNGDGTYDYSDGTKRYADGTIINGESNNIEVRTSPSWAPYFYDKTTGNQVAPIGTDKYWNPLVADSQWGVRTMYPIDNAIYNTIVANQLSSAAARNEDAAIKYANDVRDDTVVNLALAPTYLAWGVGVNWIRTAWAGTNALWRAYNTANNVLKYNRAITRAANNPIVTTYKPTAVALKANASRPQIMAYENPVTESFINRYLNTANKLANEQTVNNYARQVARNYNPVLSEWNKIVQSSSSILPQWNVVNNWVQYLNWLFNKYTPFSL